MRTKEDIREDLDKLITAQNLLSKELESLDTKPEESTRLEKLGFYDKGGDYWSLDMDNSLCSFYRDQDSGELFVGNSYKTEQDLQTAAKRREIMADLWRNSKKPINGNYNYYIYFAENGRVEKSADEECFDIGKPYFTVNKVREMIKKHGDDLKLLFI